MQSKYIVLIYVWTLIVMTIVAVWTIVSDPTAGHVFNVCFGVGLIAGIGIVLMIAISSIIDDDFFRRGGK